MISLFENQTILTKEVTCEYAKVGVRPFFRYCLILLFILCCCFSIEYYIEGKSGFTIFYLIMTILTLLLFINFSRLQGGREYKAQIAIYGEQDPVININIFEDYIDVKEDATNNNENALLIQKNESDVRLLHSKISKVYKTRNLFVLVYGNQFSLIIDQGKFIKGSPREFEEFLIKTGLKVKQKK